MDLRAGDVLQFKPTSWLGSMISWGQWTGRTREALEYCHTAIVYDAEQGIAAEMNPPKSKLYSMKNIDWSKVDVYRLNNKYVDPGQVRAVVDRKLGQTYAYQKIALHLGAGIVARLGLVKLSIWISQRFGEDEMEFCTIWALEVLEQAVGGKFKHSPCRPCDVPGFVEFIKIGQVF